MNHRDKLRRMKYLPCAIDLIKKSNFEPTTKENHNNKSELFHRFYGITKNRRLFIVQIKERRRTGEKWLMSVFPKK